MKITSITVDGVGKFDAKFEISGLDSGVNILSAGNEAGKSTFFKAVRACVFERHNTRNKEVMKLASDGKALPVTVSIGFEHAGQDYCITKSFIRSASARLTRGGAEIARNNEADEMLWEILGISPGGGRSVDEAAFGLLWVGQKESFLVPKPSEAATSALNSVIQAEVGGLVGGERARVVSRALEEELAVVITATDRPKAGGPLAEANGRFKELQTQLEEGEARLVVLDGQLTQLAIKRKERGELADPALLSGMADDLDKAQKSAKAAEQSAATLAQFETAEQKSKAVLDRLVDLRAGHDQRANRIDTARKRDKQLYDELTPILAGEAGARELLAHAQHDISKLDAQDIEDDENGRLLNYIGGVIDRLGHRDVVVRHMEALKGLGERQLKNAASLANNWVTAETSKAVDAAEREILGISARLEAAAPTVAIKLGLAAAGRVSIDDAPLTHDQIVSAIHSVTIRIGDLADITVTPPQGAGAADHNKLQTAQSRLGKLLEEAGVTSVAEFHAARAWRDELETEKRGLQAEFNAFGILDASSVVAVERLKTEIETIDGLVAEALRRLKAESLPSAQEIVSRKESLQKTRDAARLNRKTLAGMVEAQNAVLSRLAGARGAIVGARNEIKSALDGDLALLPDNEREEVIRNARKEASAALDDYRLKAAALEEQRQKSPSTDEVERRKNQVKRLSAALEAHKLRFGGLEKEIANLEGQIQSAGGDGLGEKVEELRQSRELANRDVQRLENQIGILKLLKQTIDDTYREQKERLQAPLRRHLKPYLNDVFPAAELELGDGFEIEGIKRNGPDAEKFERLSAGTQEQIAVLVRLAMGAMICERGEAAPIILDDALVFSDDERIEQMFDALIRAGQKQQVIVLTCRTRAFARLGGRLLTIEKSS